MTISSAQNAYVWIWLPGEVKPVVAGYIQKHGSQHFFTYGRSYRERSNAITISPLELPLQSGTFEPAGLNNIHSCLRDGAPDAWGRRVVNYKNPGFEPDELDYMLLSGSDRIGALDFQQSSTEYQPRGLDHPELDDLIRATEFVEKNQPLPAELDYALLHGTSVGGARPKALINDNGQQYIAKFSSSTDTYNVVKAEFVAMRLAQLADINVAQVRLTTSLGKDVLLIKRFDRIVTNQGQCRRIMLSGLSLLGLNEMEARYASYISLAELIRQHFSEPKKTLEELFRRLVFNILVGNTDDHARNHSAFWDGKALSLTPAYDVCPQPRVGQEATQAMSLEGSEGNHSTLTNCLSISNAFQIDKEHATEMIEALVNTVKDNWTSVCDEAEMTEIEKSRLWQRAILNPYCLQNW
ncbi:MAG: type II toxin-antitoxin system HipA family toxin [Gammaproteobacteria bacterium]|nr:MAG: type II toxin-antitoxin system HipA family toxin [Gammaproteobacteria bacterium]